MATEIIQIDTQDLSTQIYENSDINLISKFDIDTSLTSKSNIELFIYNINKELIYSSLNFTQYEVLNDGQSAGNQNNISQINLSPEKTLTNIGFTEGAYIVYYNFLNKNIGSDSQNLYISEISSDRTEIRLDSVSLSNEDIVSQITQFIQERDNSQYFVDFYINLGNNILLISNNIVLDNEDPANPTILVKLYEPLPEEIQLNAPLWVVTTLEEPIAYEVTFIEEPIIFDDTIRVKGPNFNIELKDQVNNSTQELSYTDLLLTSSTGSFNQISSLLEEKEIDINIDYTDFSNFIHFSSAQTRLENFYYKVGLIEQYSSSISTIESNITGSTSSSLAVIESKTILENKINNIISNFDGWDYYLYYSSGSDVYPKSTSTPPYQLESTGSISVLTWLGSLNPNSPYYGGLILSASEYDQNNKDNLLFSIPEYLREDENNRPYELFIDMVAQHFDNIWIYYKDISQKYNNDNRLDYGISRDLVADAIRDFGVKLYQNNFSNDDLYTAFLGITPSGSLFPFPNISNSSPTPSGFEYIDTFISASNDYIPLDDVNKSLYKRIYHNLPYLLKSKGTIPGLRALITSYGIPDTVLRINEFGGKDKVDINDWDHWNREFNYAWYTSGSSPLSIEWGVNPSWNSPNDVPATLQFRFKLDSLLQVSSSSPITIWENAGSSKIELHYTGSGYTSGSYDGSIIDPYYEYCELKFIPYEPVNPSNSASIYLPFANKDWWSVMVTVDGNDFTLYAGNKEYNNGDNGTSIGFFISSSISESLASWFDTGAPAEFIFSGVDTYVQEIRYYNVPLNENSFKDYVMNPNSIEGNSLNSGPNELIFRASLGGELYTGSSSIHPKITGSWDITQSFTSDSDFTFNSAPTFIPNIEYFFYDQPVMGLKNPINDKIRLENDVFPSGDTLSPLRRLSQNSEISSSYSPNNNMLEVTFSPQNEINEDINSSLGSFNVGEFIGDPFYRFSKSSTYEELDKLRNEYFQKYIKNYNLFDYIRLIKYFDNSLFKMVKDFVPARTNLISGITIKQHLLERNRYPQPQLEWEDITYSGSIEIGEIDGGTGGSFEIFNGINTSPYGPNGTGPENIFDITQSWVETTPSLLGYVSTIHDSQEEFYDGEFSGSIITVTGQVLNQSLQLENIALEYSPVFYRNPWYGISILGPLSFSTTQLLSSFTQPSDGDMLISINRVIPSSGGNSIVGVDYMKISKIDCNGTNNTNTLGQLTQLKIKYSTSTEFITYNITDIVEQSTYYLYKIEVSSDFNLDNSEIKDYYFEVNFSDSTPRRAPIGSSSPDPDILFNSIALMSGGGWSPPSSILLGNSINYFNTSSRVITYENTPNTRLFLTSSINVTNALFDGTFGFYSSYNGYFNITTIPSGSTGPYIISASITPLQGEKIAPILFKNGNINVNDFTYNSASFESNQLISPTSSQCIPILPEPYINIPNFYNSDNNPLINDVFENRQSNFYQDVDYNSGTLVPTNFDLLISGSAQKANVQDSNYTTARHIIPRYEGSKSTSQFLNIWTNQDSGTYGKLPTVESLKNYVAYCDFIGGWPPEKMNASSAHILYLIKDDGTVIIPNTSENSLNINRGTFESGERVFIKSQNTSTGEESPLRTVIRGGTRIEPILYNQIGHSPSNFTSSIELTDINQEGGVTDNFQGRVTYIGSIPTSFSEIPWGTLLSSGSESGMTLDGSPLRYRYIISNDMITEGVSIILKTTLNIRNNNTFTSSVWARFKNLTTGQVIGETRGIESTGATYGNINGGKTGVINIQFTLSNDQLVNGDRYIVEIIAGHSNITLLNNSIFEIEQIPIPNNVINIDPIGSYPFQSSGSLLYTTTSSLIDFFGNNNTYQKNISGSGFNSISIPWGLQYGDEVRFEGDENKVWVVRSAQVVNILNQTSLFIVLDRPIPPNININKFLFRRYVNDASSILLEGYKPEGSEGPFILKPEYCSPSLNKNIDQFILDLTEKGLL
jgi:hypothetical protein